MAEPFSRVTRPLTFSNAEVLYPGLAPGATPSAYLGYRRIPEIHVHARHWRLLRSHSERCTVTPTHPSDRSRGEAGSFSFLCIGDGASYRLRQEIDLVADCGSPMVGLSRMDHHP